MKNQIYNAVKGSCRAIKRNCSPFALSCNMCVVLSVPSRLSPVFAVAGAAALIICAVFLFFCIRDHRRYKTEKNRLENGIKYRRRPANSGNGSTPPENGKK